MGDKLHCYHFAYRCPQSWDSLTPTALEGVRYCGHCSENV